MSTLAAATAVLHTATPATDRKLLAWAVGAFRVRHCLDLAQYRRTADPTVLDDQCTGGVTHELDYDIDTRGFAGLAHATEYRFTVTWRQVATVLDRVVHQPDLVDEQRELLRLRVQFTAEKDALFRRWQRGDQHSPTETERDTHHRQWSQVERRCEEAAARTWQACYPQHQQLALFA